jgi:hypothetical protein
MTPGAGRMSLVQRIVTSLVPRATAERMRTESLDWMVRCDACGFERSVWESGGIRAKAAGRPKTYRPCGQCGQRGWHTIYRKSGSVPGAAKRD